MVTDGRLAMRERRWAEALEFFTNALALEPDHLEALGNRGSVLGALKRYDEALNDYDRAIAISPALAMLHYNRGSALYLLGRPADAVTAFDQALAIKPDAAEAWNNRGNALREMNSPRPAIESYGKAIALRPQYAKALYNRGNANWVDLRQIEPALADMERAFTLDPESDNLRGDLLHLRMHVADWRDFDSQKELIEQGVRAGRHAVGPFAYQAIAHSPSDLKTCSEIYAADRYPPRPAPARKTFDRDKIRIGYLCGEFREQATSFLMAGIYEQHDRGRFHVAAFDSRGGDGSALRKRLENSFDAFTDISQLTDDDAAAAIAAQEIDILVNLNGYFGVHRMGVFARQPAPVQVNYLGFPATLGAPYMDYILADAIVIPENEKKFYSEKVVHLPVSYQANDSKRASPAAPPRAEHGLPAQGFVFCNLNQSYKLTPHIFAAWMRILDKVPGSVLWLLEGNSLFAANIRAQARGAGIAPERIIFAPMIDAALHQARIGLADLCLDTSPYNSHTSGSDVLWAGVPLLTLEGTTFPGRVAESLLAAVGLDELVAGTMEEYEKLAVALARDPARMKSLRARLIAGRQPLFDTAAFCRALEEAYQKMWALARNDRPAESFSV